jgi:hypothetical protein
MTISRIHFSGKGDPHLAVKLHRLYWLMRAGVAIIWSWTAYVSWFVFPQAESLDWLRRIGLTHQTYFWFVSACLFDFVMGLASAFFASRLLWCAQILTVFLYSIVIAFGLPEFFVHPFGPLIKNIAVLACLVYLVVMQPTAD